MCPVGSLNGSGARRFGKLRLVAALVGHEREIFRQHGKRASVVSRFAQQPVGEIQVGRHVRPTVHLYGCGAHLQSPIGLCTRILLCARDATCKLTMTREVCRIGAVYNGLIPGSTDTVVNLSNLL